MLAGVLVLAAWQPRLVRELTGREFLAGCLLGSVFFAGFTLQTWGMNSISPALSAFLTSLCCVWAPVLGWACLGRPVTGVVGLGLMLALAGTAVLSLEPREGNLPALGVWLTLIASVLFAVQLLLLDHLGRGMRGASLTVGFLAVSGVLGAVLAIGRAHLSVGEPRWWEWFIEHHRDGRFVVVLAVLVVFPTLLGMHWMNTYQPRVSPARAALIYLLEPVFTALISIPWGLDEPSVRLAAGGTLILAGNALVELWGRREN